MAVAPIRFRSISLPTRLPSSTNPTNSESELKKLQSWSSEAKAVPISSEAIQSGLMGLAELYNSVDELVQSPANQKSTLEESLVLDGSVELIDSCNNIRELFQLIRENVQILQSALRRKGQDSTIQTDITTYFSIRKKMNKSVSKSLKSLKNLEINITRSNEDCKLREVMGVTIEIFKCVLVFLSSQVAKSGGWSFVSKLILSKSEKENCASEVGNLDLVLNDFQSKIRNNGAGIFELKMVQKRLQNLDDCVEGIELGLERLFRVLIQSRVAILNSITDL